MSKLIKKLFEESMLGAVIVISFLVFTGLIYLIPQFTKNESIKSAYHESQELTRYIKIFRSYYANDILKKVKKFSDLEINYDHKSQEKTIPLPATLVHDLAATFTKTTDISVEMYSNYPFPNRLTRVLDPFQKKALAFILKNPEKSFSREDIVNGIPVYRTAFGDPLSLPSCVSCHNTRADTPKNDWKLGDIRGVIEVQIPLHSNTNLIYSVLLFIALNLLLLGLYYFFQIKRNNNKLQSDVTNKNKLLSEYKRAVDIGAIVSKSDAKGRISYINDAFIDISGYSKSELIGNSHSMVKHPDTDKEVFQEMWKKLSNKEVWQGNLKNKKKDGSAYYVQATIIPILDENDTIVEFLAIRFDTSSLHEAVQRANNAEKAKGDFLANMSHELRTPLNAIIGFSQILQRRNKLDDKDASYVQKIHLSGENLLNLVNSILDFSKIEEGEMEFSPSQVNILELFNEINILLEMQIEEKSISLKQNGFTKDATIFADKQLLKQAMINILSNAIKFTPQNGTINLEYSLENTKHIFKVCDNGVGISPDDIKNLFKPFKQGTSAKKILVKGTGLGLAITHTIITKLHKGTISVISEENEFTCFTITL